MESIDVLVLRHLREWLASGHRAILLTVVRTWGSSPRQVWAMMALRDDGRTVGSVSGGCIEDDLIHKYSHAHGKNQIPDAPPCLVKYGVSAEEAHRFGLPCGGTLELLLEFAPTLESLDELVHRLEAGELVRRTVSIQDGNVTLGHADIPDVLRLDEGTLENTLGPEYRMLLIGAGTLTEYVATMALFNGFSVTICDPRPEYTGAWSVRGVRIVTEMPDDAVLAFKPDQRSCIVALTHDPKLDDLALLEALHSPAFYVGAIGSRRNSQSRKERMKTYFDETEESLKRLRGPVGIHIGSKTPAEIAISVMAEILATKNGIKLPEAWSVSLAKQ